MRFLCAAMLLVSFAACDEKENGNDNPGGGNNNYSTLILGDWKVDLMTVDGQNMTPPNMQLSFYENGSGLMNDGGVDEHNDFTWVINGNTINVTTDKHQFTFTIDNLTATECAFHGNYIEFDGHDITGVINFHMIKMNGDNPDDPDPDDPNWVDLGLPSGLLWATCNVGATSPEDYGDYFAWGETQTKTAYNWENYRYGHGSHQLTKYCDDPDYGADGYTDNLTTLEPGDDAATANIGNGARTPTKTEWEEMVNNTTRERTSLNGVDGWKFTAPNGNSIFLPGAGEMSSTGTLLDAGPCGHYWSSTLGTDGPDYAWQLGYTSTGFGGDLQTMTRVSRKTGISVRAVKNAN